jgi:hypothetical protein
MTAGIEPQSAAKRPLAIGALVRYGDEVDACLYGAG